MFFVNVASKRLSPTLSLLFATLAGRRINVADKGFTRIGIGIGMSGAAADPARHPPHQQPESNGQARECALTQVFRLGHLWCHDRGSGGDAHYILKSRRIAANCEQKVKRRRKRLALIHQTSNSDVAVSVAVCWHRSKVNCIASA